MKAQKTYLEIKKIFKRFSIHNVIFIIFSILQTKINLKIYSGEWNTLYLWIGIASIIFVLIYNSNNKKIIETGIVLFIIHSFKIFDKELIFLDFILVHALVFLILLYLLNEIYYKRLSFPRRNLFNLSLLLFAGLGLISTLNSVCIYNALQQYLLLLDFLIVTFIIANYFTKKSQFKLIVNTFLIIAIILISLASLNLISMGFENIKRLLLTRLRIEYIHPNSIAGYLNVIILLSIPIFLKTKKIISKILYLLLIFISLIFSLLTFSRLGTFSLLFCLILFLFMAQKTKRRYLFESRLILILIVLSVVIFLIPKVNSMLVNRIVNIHSNNANFYNCAVVLEAIKDRPFIGAGLENHYLLSNYGDVPFLNSKDYNLSLEETQVLLNCKPHSLFLGITWGLGILGLMGFILICFIAIKNAKPIIINQKKDGYQDRAVLGCFLALSSILIHGILAMPFHFTILPVVFWVMIGLIMSPKNLQTKETLFTLNKRIIKIIALFIVLLEVFIIIPLVSEYYYEKGIQYRQNGEFKRALKEIQKARLFYYINPKYSELLRDLYIENNMKKDAIKISKELIRLKKYYAPYHAKLGELYWQLGLYATSIEELKKAVTFDKLGAHGGEHYSQLGMAYIYLGRYKEAYEVYKEGLRLIPNLKHSSFARKLKG